MIRSVIIAVLSATACLTSLATAQSTTAPVDTGWVKSDLGEMLITPMANAPYPHESRKDGFRNGNKFFPRDPHYVDNSVALFIPRGYKPGDSVDLLFYWHGHSNNIRGALTLYKLRERIVASGKNVIMVFPEGPKDAADSGCGKLEDKDGLKHLADEVLDRLAADGKIRTRKLGRVLLAGHSGAYRVMAFCVKQGGLEDHLTDVALLDSSYGQLDFFIDWLAHRSTARLFSIFTDHLAPENAYLMTHLRQRGIKSELAAEQYATDDLVRNSRVIFLYAEKLDHNGTVVWLQRWLAATSLPTR